MLNILVNSLMRKLVQCKTGSKDNPKNRSGILNVQVEVKTVFSMVMGVRMEVKVRVEVGVIPLDRIHLHKCKQKLVSIAISYLQLLKL